MSKQLNLFTGEEDHSDEPVRFVRWITHPVTKKRIYPRKGKVFPIRGKRRIK